MLEEERCQMKKNSGKHLWALSLAVLMCGTAMPLQALTSRVKDNSIKTTTNSSVAQTLGSNIQTEFDFNEDWKFVLNLEDDSDVTNIDYADTDWTSVNLPHDFSISQSFTTDGEAQSGYLPGGTGWYRKSFTLEEEDAGKTITINFDGAYKDTYLYVNGQYVGENHYGYNNFAFDITDQLVYDGATSNVIAVKVDHQLPSSRWYSGSGIYRDVTLIKTNKLHFTHDGTYITTPNIANGIGTVNAEVALQNDSSSTKEITVLASVRDENGIQVSTFASKNLTLMKGKSQTETFDLLVDKPTLWSLDNPYRYKLHLEIISNGQVVDSNDINFGFRYYSFNAGSGFSLNGQNLKINGVCLHHDQGALGAVANYDAIYRQLTMMKEMGANAIRVTHNPASKHLIEICDEIGLLVVEEFFDGWKNSKNSNSQDFSLYFNKTITADNNIEGATTGMTWAEFVIKNVVMRDRNAPSIIMWSLGNEVVPTNGYDTIAENLAKYTHNYDTTRHVTNADNSCSTDSTSWAYKVDQKILEADGIVGFNYAKGTQFDTLLSIYGGERQVINASESASAINSRGVYNTYDTDEYHLTSYDNKSVTWGQTAHSNIYDIITRDFVAGCFVWTGFDYIGEPTPWNKTDGMGTADNAVGTTPNSSYFGIVDTAGFEKDSYYLYRSQWKQDDTTLHLVTAWDDQNQILSSGKTPVWVYSNAPVVKLYLNDSDEPIGTATRTVVTTSAGHKYFTYTTLSNDSSLCETTSGSGSASLYSVFSIAYNAGTIRAVAYDENGNVITETHGKSTVSTPDRTTLKLDTYSNKNTILADGTSLAYITIDVTDANGNLDTVASNKINLSLEGEGEIVGVDNGDQATNDKFQQSSVLTSKTTACINAYAGKALVIVRSTKTAGEITLTASSDGLEDSVVTLTTSQTIDEKPAIESYTYNNEYTMTAGSTPLLSTKITATLSTNKLINGIIEWQELTSEQCSTPGIYTINGVARFDGYDAINVSATLTVFGETFALRNVSIVTEQGLLPKLPERVSGLDADGNLSGEYDVTWESISESQFSIIGSIIKVKGQAVVNGVSLPVTCNVRVIDSLDIQTDYVDENTTLEQDIAEDKQSDNLDSIKDGNVWSPVLDTKDSDLSTKEKQERWTNYNNRSASRIATITFSFTEAKEFGYADIYYYLDSTCKLPESIAFSYLADDDTYQTISYVQIIQETHYYTSDSAKTGQRILYKFVNDAGENILVNSSSIKVEFTAQKQAAYSNYCMGVTEIEMGKLERATAPLQTSADLTEILVDGEALENFNSETLLYTTTGKCISVSGKDNVAVTILPVNNNVYKIYTLAEDGTSKVYSVTVDGKERCQHLHIEVRGAEEPSCTDAGYTGDVYCTDCGELVSTGYEIPALGHNWDEGVVIKEATLYEDGEMLYTCKRCNETKTEVIPHFVIAPTVNIVISEGSETNITLKGEFVDYSHVESYYSVESKGFIVVTEQSFGDEELLITTAGLTKINVVRIDENGFYSFNFKPFHPALRYVVRAYMAYRDPETNELCYAYSDAQTVCGLQFIA